MQVEVPFIAVGTHVNATAFIWFVTFTPAVSECNTNDCPDIEGAAFQFTHADPLMGFAMVIKNLPVLSG